ncbi:glycerol-3-phosphate acyltransferase 3-like isoform X2 [Oratosquilla oratoria]|uniref:glycerol-3-phosphate acyltransferase 3-like isoform X2 n=1 Tax=Oratosquilla oratoria TaxID=337810 RepID=UPI003F75CC91
METPTISETEKEVYEWFMWITPILFWGHLTSFVSLLLVATIGRPLGLRRKYVALLDRVFLFAQLKLSEPKLEDEDLEEDDRTKKRRYLRLSPSLTIFWLVGCIIRYVFLMPMRAIILVVSLANLVVCTSLVGLLPGGEIKKKINALVVMWCFDFVAGSLSVVARFHDTQYRPQYGIAVANHTSPIDSMVLATDQCYDMVGQKTRGLLGVFMSALSKSSTHIWFERGESKERAEVARRLRSHATDTSLPPILIFPEGTCVNNTAILQFKKGAFEIGSVIYPIAIRFDPRYGDAFWWQDTFGQYAFSMMTSWAIVCDVYYLPPMVRGENESSIAFANRVKALIAHRAGFVDLAWDGFIKLQGDKLEAKKEAWKRIQQGEYARHLSHKDQNAEASHTENDNKDIVDGHKEKQL